MKRLLRYCGLAALVAGGAFCLLNCDEEVRQPYGGPYLGDIDFVRGSGWIDRVWADVQWHLYEAGGGWGTYWIARDAVFGRAFVYQEGVNRTVTISKDGDYLWAEIWLNPWWTFQYDIGVTAVEPASLGRVKALYR